MLLFQNLPEKNIPPMKWEKITWEIILQAPYITFPKIAHQTQPSLSMKTPKKPPIP